MNGAHAPGLRVIALVLAFLGANALSLAILSLSSGGAAQPPLLGAVGALLALGFLLAAGGLWFRRAWARPVAMVSTTLLAMLVVLSLFQPSPGQSRFIALLTLAAMMATLLYLQRPHVRAALR